MSIRDQVGKLSISKRKDPKQKRSGELVTALLDSAARILSTRELDETSTNQIAELAGISIGSFYQYFPNKESLASAVMARILETHAGFNDELDKAHPNLKGEEKIRLYLDYFYSHFMKHRTLIRVLGRHLVRIKQLDNLIHTRILIKEAVKNSLLKDIKDITPGRAEAMALVVVASIAGIFEAIAFIDLNEKQIGAMKIEMEAMLVAYLAP